MTGKEAAKKAFELVEKNDKEGFNEFLNSLSEEEYTEMEHAIREYQEIAEGTPENKEGESE